MPDMGPDKALSLNPELYPYPEDSYSCRVSE